MDLGLKDKTVIVTGGASNIGRGIALAFARAGANTVIADLDLPQAEKVAEEARAEGGQCFPIKVDVTDWGSVEGMVKSVVDRFGGVDVLVNDVGWVHDVLFIEKPREEWDKEIRLNFLSVLNCTRAVLDHMIPKQSGTIVNIGSDAGRMGEYRESVYSGCKGAVIAFSKSVAREVGRYNITVNVVCPGTTIPEDIAGDVGTVSMWAPGGDLADMATPEMAQKIGAKYPLRRIAKANDIAGAVVFLASEPARYITGQTISVSGGYSMM